MKDNKKLLAIDARPLARNSGGIQRYLEKLLPHIVSDSKLEVILYTDLPINFELDGKSNKPKVRSVPYSFCHAIFWHFLVCRWVAIDQPDIFWSPRHHLPLFLPERTKRVVTIHDFVWKTYPSTMPKLQRLSEMVLMPLALKSASKIICISQTTQSQLSHFFPTQSPKSTLILHGAYKTKSFAPPYSNKKSDYFLAVGTLEPRKNYERLIIAFDQYVNNGGIKNLIIVGKYGWRYATVLKTLNNLDNADRIQILQDISDNELSDLYSNACGFISPSLDEGYGLPPQEAMHYELPLLLSDIDVYRELYSEASFWVNPLSTDELTSALSELEKSEKINLTCSNKIKHSWEDCAREHSTLFLKT